MQAPSAAAASGEVGPCHLQFKHVSISGQMQVNAATVVVGVVMGSSSDWETMRQAADILTEFGIAHEARVVSAHRMPDEMFAYAEAAAGRGLKAIIAGAGGAAHLPGMLAAKTTVPVLGVPVASRHLQGVDSLHSIVQMPKGIPVATFAIGAAGAANAALVRGRDARLRVERAAHAAGSVPRSPARSRGGDDRAVEMTPGSGFIAPGATLGVMGGGQLGRMFVHAAQQMGYFTAVLDPDPASPAGLVAHYHIASTYLDEQGLAQLMQRSARGHDRIRECAGCGAAHAGRAAAGGAGCRRGGGVPGPGGREGPLPPRRRRRRPVHADRGRQPSWRRSATSCFPASSRRPGWATTARARRRSLRAPIWPRRGRRSAAAAACSSGACGCAARSA